MKKLKIFFKTFFVSTLFAQGFLFAPKCIVVLNQFVESKVLPYAFFQADVASCNNLSEIIEKNFYFPPIANGRAPLLILSRASFPTRKSDQEPFIVGLVFGEKIIPIRRENGILPEAVLPNSQISKFMEELTFNSVIQSQKSFFAAFDQALGVEPVLPKVYPALLPDVILYGALLATNGSPWAEIVDWQKISPEMRVKMFGIILNGPIGRYKFPQFWRSGKNPPCGCGSQIDHLIPVSINLHGIERVTIGLPNVCLQCEDLQNSQARNACTRAKIYLMMQAKRVLLERQAWSRGLIATSQPLLAQPAQERVLRRVGSTPATDGAQPIDRAAGQPNLGPIMNSQFRRPETPMPSIAQRRPRPAEGLAPELEAKRPR